MIKINNFENSWVAYFVVILILVFVFQVISYDSARGGISVITEKADVSTSYLLIQNANSNDSGRYICAPSNAGEIY